MFLTVLQDILNSYATVNVKKTLKLLNVTLHQTSQKFINNRAQLGNLNSQKRTIISKKMK